MVLKAKKEFQLAFAVTFIILFGVGCAETSKETNAITDRITFNEKRWYNRQQFDMGKQVFTENCSQCHGKVGQGLVDDWKTRNPDGSFPPPPLNGTAHTWHHSTEVLIETINNGGIPLGGSMPGFKEILSLEEKLAVVAYIQNLWDDETYDKWLKINNSN